MELAIGSLEFRFLVDRAFAARQFGQRSLADALDRATERYVCALIPAFAEDISKVASRKGEGDNIAKRLSEKLSPELAATVVLVWLLRGARRSGVTTLSRAFRRKGGFDDTLRMLCRRVL